MKIRYFVPSYKRAKAQKTMNFLSKAELLVDYDEYDEYIKYNPQFKDRIIRLPRGIQGNKSRVLNYMLDVLWKDEDAIVHLDDDIICLEAHEKDGKDRRIEDEDEFYELCENFCLLGKEWDCPIWGLSINSDPLSYDEFKPFRLHAYINGGILGYTKKTDLRYDEELTIKEDIDFVLQNLKEFHKALRIEKYYLNVLAFTNKGGMQEFRNVEEEKRQFKRMQEKWGSKIIRPNKPTAKKNSKIRGMNGAIKINVPLKGC